MKNWKKIVAAVLCLMLIEIPVLEPFFSAQTVQAAASKTTVKNGFKRENGEYYYYVNGQKVKNAWKNVTVTDKTTGKKISYRHYFTGTGKAYRGGTFFGENYITVKKIGNNYYGFNKYSQMVKGIRYSAYGPSKAGFYAFTNAGVLDSKKTASLRRAFVREKSSAALRKLLGSPRRTKKVSGCYGDGQEYMLEYTSFWVNTYKDKKGKEIVLDVISK